MGILDEAESIASESSQDVTARYIKDLIDKHPGGQCLFLIMDEASNTLETFSTMEVDGQLYLAEVFRYTLLSGLWGGSQAEEE